jgi:NAD(P)H dehydrogenase (quinone)
VTVIGISGASGALGRLAAQYVLQSHPTNNVVLLSRTPASVALTAPAGVTVRHADFDEPERLVDACRGIDVILLISTDAIGQRSAQHQGAITAAAAARVARIVYTSTTNADHDFPTQLQPLTDDHSATEEALRGAGPSWTLLRNAFYFEAFARLFSDTAATGQLVTNYGSGCHAAVSRDDCAAAAAAVLVGQGHDGGVYDITGPELLDNEAVAAALAAQYRRPVAVFHASDDDYYNESLAAGIPAAEANLLTGFGISVRTGLMQAPLGDTDKLIGRPATSLQGYLTFN